MSWRVVVISSRCKLDLSMNYMVVRGDGNKRVSLNEIAVLILENNAVSMTGCLLSALIEKRFVLFFVILNAIRRQKWYHIMGVIMMR